VNIPYKNILILVVVAVVAFSAGRFVGPSESSEQAKVVTKVATVRDKKIDENMVETKKETRLPNGVVITESRTERQVTTDVKTQRNSETSSATSKTVKSHPGYRVGFAYQPDIPNWQTPDSHYQATIERRIFSELYMGVSITEKGILGVSISLGF